MLYSPDANAYGAVVAAAGWPELRLLAVAPAARAGRGYGACRRMHAARKARRAAALGLHTSESLRAGMHMYERMSFVGAPEGDFQPSRAELVMAYRVELDDCSVA